MADKPSPAPAEPSRHARGLAAEHRAIACLINDGYTLLHHRFKVREGEIDLVMTKGDILAFIEVKTRRTLQAALDSVDWKSRRRILAASEIWLQRHPDEAARDQRFDIVAILPRGGFAHLTDAYRAWD